MTVRTFAYGGWDLTQTTQGTQVRTFEYDGLHRKTSQTLPESGTTTYAYTHSDGLLSSMTDARGVTTTYTYDAAHRLTGRSYTGGTPPVPTPAVSFTYDTRGNRTRMTDAMGTVRYSYDTMDRLTREARTLSGLTGTFTTGYGYDRKGNLTQVTYPSGRVVGYNYATGGGCCNSRLDSVMDQTTDTTLLSARTYQAFGGTLTQTLGNGATQSFSYNSRLQLTRITAAAGGHTVMDFSYGYVSIDENGVTTDENTGRVRSRTDAVQSEHSATYDYDSIYRLEQVQGADESWGVSWTFDTWGNRLTQAPSGLATSKVGTQTLGYTSTTNRNTAFMYDAAGNQKTDGTHNYTFNAANQITQMDAGAAVYTYDGDGRRMKKTVGTETIYYFYAMGVLVSEFSTTNTGATGAASTDRTTYQTSDKLGTAVLFMAASGLVIENNRTLPYGEEWLPSPGSDNEQKFTSYQRDGESGLDYAIHRFDATTRGVFMSVDRGPITLALPQSLNRYIYAMADPVNYTDPSGLSREVPIPAPVRPIDWPGWMTLLGSNIGSYLESPTIPEFPQTDSGVDCASIMNLLGGGETAFGDLGPDRRLVLQSIIVAGVGAGLNFSNITISRNNVLADRIRLSTAVGDDLRIQIEGNENFTASGWLEKGWTKFLGWFGGGHRGADNFLARQNVYRNSLQFGTGDDYAFLDIDRFNPRPDLWSLGGHAMPHLNRVNYRSFLNERGYEPCP